MPPIPRKFNIVSRNLHRNRLEFSTLEDRNVPAITWVGGATGSWDTAANWSNDAVPTSATDISITAPGVMVTASGTDAADSITTGITDVLSVTGGSLTVSSISVASSLGGGFNLSGGTLAFAGTVQINGACQWSGGTLEGPAIDIASTASMAVTGGNTKTLSAFQALTPGALYVTDLTDRNLYSVIGSTATALSPRPTDAPDSIILDKNNTFLYTAYNNDQLRRYNPATGADTLVCSFPSGSGPVDMLLNPNENSVLVSYQKTDEIVQVDLNYTTGTGTLDANVNLATSGEAGGLAYGPNGRLFAIVSSTTLDELTLTATSLTVKSSHVNSSADYDGLCYDPATNKLFASGYSTDSVYEINPNSFGINVTYTNTTSLKNPDGLESDGKGTLYVAARSNNDLVSFSTTGFSSTSTLTKVATVTGIDDVLPLGGTGSLQPTVINNSGVITDSGTSTLLFGDATLNNMSGGVVQMTSTETLAPTTGGGTVINLSGGLFQITSQTKTTVPFNNKSGGTIEVDPGAVFLARWRRLGHGGYVQRLHRRRP